MQGPKQVFEPFNFLLYDTYSISNDYKNEIRDTRTSSSEVSIYMFIVKCTSDGKADAMCFTGLGKRQPIFMVSFWIGAAEKKLKSSCSNECSNILTSLTGRPGIRYRSQGNGAKTQVKLGKLVASTLMLSTANVQSSRCVRLG